MRAFNLIIIAGHLGRDPELRYTPQGNAVCNFSLATTEKRGDQETTTWFRVSAWGKQGELCNEYLKKGSEVYVQGRLRMESYTDRDGNTRYNLEVNASDVHFLGRKSDNGGDGYNAPRAESQGRRDALKTSAEIAQQVVADEDIPF